MTREVELGREEVISHLLKILAKLTPTKKWTLFQKTEKIFLVFFPISLHFNYLIVIQLLSYFWEMLFVFMSPLRQTISCYLPSKNIHFAKSK